MYECDNFHYKVNKMTKMEKSLDQFEILKFTKSTTVLEMALNQDFYLLYSRINSLSLH